MLVTQSGGRRRAIRRLYGLCLELDPSPVRTDRRFILEQQRLTGIFALGVALVNSTPHYNFSISLGHFLLNEYPLTSSSQSTAPSNKTQEIKRDADRYRDSIR